MLAGKTKYTGKERVDQLLKYKICKRSVHKLRNILATIDGLIMQLVLCFPDREEYMNWAKIDSIIYCLLTQLIPDYFRDVEGDLSTLTTFEKVKKLRKAIKQEGFHPSGDLSKLEVPRELSFFRTYLSFIGAVKTPRTMYQVTAMSQTRASGVPPRSVYLKTLEKIKVILQEPPNHDVYNIMEPYIKLGVDILHNNVVESLGSESNSVSFWRKALDMAKISLSDSGEFFTNSESGGKLEACREVLHYNKNIEEIDVETGQPTGKLLNKENSTVGEMIFHWACGQFTDRTRCYERNLMSVRISLVAELGKFRGITVSHLAHAVILHVMSHILLEYIRQIPSSTSGVGAANHAWNFFKRLSHKNPHANFLFGDKEVYLFSTDWEQATDYCDHTVAQAMINRIAYNVGFPTWYRETCCFALCAPRQVEFIDQDTKTLECFYSCRGELMGDPVVKVILHLYHIVARIASIEEVRKV
jgi:hypothetical protein